MDPDTEQDFVASLRSAGLAPPAERYAPMLESYIALRELARALWEPLDYRIEPAGLYVPPSSPDDLS